MSVDVHDHVITGQSSTALTGARIWTSLSPAHVQPSALMQLRPLLRATAICPDDQLAPVRIPSRRGPRRSTFQLYIPSGSRRPDHSNNLYSIHSHPLFTRRPPCAKYWLGNTSIRAPIRSKCSPQLHRFHVKHATSRDAVAIPLSCEFAGVFQSARVYN